MSQISRQWWSGRSPTRDGLPVPFLQMHRVSHGILSNSVWSHTYIRTTQSPGVLPGLFFHILCEGLSRSGLLVLRQLVIDPVAIFVEEYRPVVVGDRVFANDAFGDAFH